MSRIGRMPIEIPSGTKVAIVDGEFIAKGPKGEVRERLLDEIPVEVGEKEVQVSRTGETGDLRSKHGLMRALLNNAVVGVTEGFSKHLEIHGVGYRAEVKGKEVHFALGYSHPVIFSVPEGIDVEIDKQGKITVSGANRQTVGQVAAEMRALRKPDPYKGKGIRYADEIVRRKVGKAGAK